MKGQFPHTVKMCYRKFCHYRILLNWLFELVILYMILVYTYYSLCRRLRHRHIFLPYNGFPYNNSEVTDQCAKLNILSRLLNILISQPPACTNRRR